MKYSPYLMLLGILVALFASPSCVPENSASGSPSDSLPAITDTGANTFACKVNGAAWIARNERPTPGEYTLQGFYISEDSLFGVNAKRVLLKAKKNEYLGFSITRLVGPGTYQFSDTNGASYDDYALSKQFRTDSIHRGVVHISRLDTVKKIIAGTFSFVAKSTKGVDTIVVTNGRFDMHYDE